MTQKRHSENGKSRYHRFNSGVISKLLSQFQNSVCMGWPEKTKMRGSEAFMAVAKYQPHIPLHSKRTFYVFTNRGRLVCVSPQCLHA